MSLAALEVEGLEVKLATFVILRGISLHVPHGGIVGLVGRNGAGKTTTLRSIIGLVPILRGSVHLNGQELTHRSPHERVRLGIGYLPEDRRLIASLTVEENLLLPLWAADQDDGRNRLARIYDLMPEVKRLADRRAAALSGGQQKMVALARAVMAGTKLLLLDEPFEGLAPLLARHLAEVIRASRDVAVLVTESDVNRIRLLTDRICTIERGEMVRDSAAGATGSFPDNNRERDAISNVE